jgi:hypothetical protein
MLPVTLLLVAATLGCGEKPRPVFGPGKGPESIVEEPEPVAEPESFQKPSPVPEPKLVVGEAKQSPPGPKLGRDAAIAAIRGLGGSFDCSEGSPERPIVKVALTSTQVTDAGLEHLKGLTSLKLLVLPDARVTDAGVTELKKALPNCHIHRPPT